MEAEKAIEAADKSPSGGEGQLQDNLERCQSRVKEIQKRIQELDERADELIAQRLEIEQERKELLSFSGPSGHRFR